MAQHDYTVDNGSGFGVRTDINNALAAIVSQNSGTEPSTTFPYMVWADAGNDLLKIRNAADTGWVSIYTLSTGVPISGGSSLGRSIDTAQTGVLAAATTWLVDTSIARSRALPAGADGDEIGFADDVGDASTNTITITPNGAEKIMGVNAAFTISTSFAKGVLKFYSANSDWRLVP